MGKPRPLGKCVYCDALAHTVDHWIPISQGGTSAPKNLVPACFECNEVKGDLLAEDFFWKCKEIVEQRLLRYEKFRHKAKKILESWAPELA